MAHRVHSVVLLVLALFARPAGAAGPPLLRDPEPAAVARAPEHLRAPVELVPKIVVELPLCGSGTDEDRCSALGPSFGPELAALYRPTPYFAFGGTAAYTRGSGSLDGHGLTATRLELAVAARVYLTEAGALEPYLEGFVGWTGERTTLARPGTASDRDTAHGPFARAGGGLEWFAASDVKLGVTGGFSQLLFARGEVCRAGQCAAGDAPASTPSGVVTLGLSVSVLLGQPL